METSSLSARPVRLGFIIDFNALTHTRPPRFMLPEDFVKQILAEREISGDWVSVAGALGVNDISPFTATKEIIREALSIIAESDEIYFGKIVENRRLEETSGEGGIDSALDQIFSSDEKSDQVAEMMRIFIDRY